MAKRPSPLPVDAARTLWLICVALRDAKGTAGDPLDAAVKKYADDPDEADPITLTATPLGLFAANQPAVFTDFKTKFDQALDDRLQSFNWLPPSGAAESPNNWKITTTLGVMAADLVDEFDSLVKFAPPAPVR